MQKPVRYIFFDTETTGVDPQIHSVIEIGCVVVELRNGQLVHTDETYQQYINPQQDIDYGATLVHGLTKELLIDKPTFGQIVDNFLDFIKDGILVAHNAQFDINFINKELSVLGKSVLKNDVIDTLEVAKKKYKQFSKHSLQYLCEKFNIQLISKRKFHGALLDAYLLSYLGFYLFSEDLSFNDLLDDTIHNNNIKECLTFNRTIEYNYNDNEIQHNNIICNKYNIKYTI